MEFKIKKTTEETIVIETPKYFKSKYGSTISKLNENGITKAAKHYLSFHPFEDSAWFNAQIKEMIEECEETTSESFLLKLQESLESIKEVALSNKNL